MPCGQKVVGVLIQISIIRRNIQEWNEMFYLRGTWGTGMISPRKLFIRSLDTFHNIRMMRGQGLGGSEVDQRMAFIMFVAW
jgi:hypothetical protein